MHQRVGTYRFWRGNTEIWTDPDAPLRADVMAMDAVAVSCLPPQPPPDHVLLAGRLDVTLIGPQGDVVQVDMPEEATVADATRVAAMHFGVNAHQRLIPRTAERQQLDGNCRIDDIFGCCDIFFTAIIDVVFIDRAEAPATWIVQQIGQEESLGDMYPGRMVANRYGVVFQTQWTLQPQPIIVIKPEAAVRIALQLGRLKNSVVDGETPFGTFVQMVEEYEKLGFEDENGTLMSDVFMKSITGTIVSIGHPEQPRVSFFCARRSNQHAFFVTLRMEDPVARVRTFCARRCQTIERYITLHHGGQPLQDDVMVSKLDIHEGTALYVIDDSLRANKANPALDQMGRLSIYDLLVLQIARITKHSLLVCKRVFEATKWDYDATIAQLRSSRFYRFRKDVILSSTEKPFIVDLFFHFLLGIYEMMNCFSAERLFRSHIPRQGL
jgi:hypothetical protein